MRFFLAAGLVAFSTAPLTLSNAADKGRVFALVPKTISVPSPYQAARMNVVRR